MSAPTTTIRKQFQKHSEAADKLLRQLLECVQKCQKRYGGRTELATELDSCVVALCLTLEAVFLHGIRTKPQEKSHLSAIKQVSDIVANGLQAGSDPSFWPFIKKHLTKHEEERYSLLKHIWTNVGRGRAWIRSTLNERSLERYFHLILGNVEILKIYYEDYAIFRDDEKSSMLPNMAAGIGSILFAINIDKPELNSNVQCRVQDCMGKFEPIIEAPMLENKQHQKNTKKKVARQFISFDEDNTSVLSTSAPSTSSSICSDTNSVNDNQSHNDYCNPNSKETFREKNNIPIIEKVSNIVAVESLPKRTLVETTHSPDEFNTFVPRTLTPVADSEIGELTPVSVEISKLANPLDDFLEIPSDVSEVLGSVERRNKEELQRKEEKIESLTKENELLKEQVKKYVSAIQMLQGNVDSQEHVNQEPDYKFEAKLFEKKLVQVAEMHAELMDFNVVLQQSLCQKDLQLEQLKSEVESLHTTISMDEITSEIPNGNVNIWIPSAFLTGSGSSAYHVYQIFIRAGNDEWNIYRRYAQFYALHTNLKKLDPSVTTFDFPPKKSIGNKESPLVEERRKRLQTYLRKVLTHWPELTHCSSRILLEQQFPFFKEQTDIHQKKVLSPSRNKNASDNHYTGL